jgi:hypothetical protein
MLGLGGDPGGGLAARLDIDEKLDVERVGEADQGLKGGNVIAGLEPGDGGLGHAGEATEGGLGESMLNAVADEEERNGAGWGETGPLGAKLGVFELLGEDFGRAPKGSFAC